jgi:hypothetical protein
MFGMLYHVSSEGFAPFRYGKLPDMPFATEDIPHIFAKEFARVMGIGVSVDETEIVWDVCINQPYESHASPREYFLDNGLLGWKYRPKTRLPGESWRWGPSWQSHEVCAACKRMKFYGDGFLSVEARLARWGLVMYIATKIQEFQCEYSDRPEEWARILRVIDVRNEDIQITLEFTRGMHLLNPINDLIPIRVLEVVTVFRVLFRLSLQQFELAYSDSS